MLGFGPIGSGPIGVGPVALRLADGAKQVKSWLSGIIIPERKGADVILLKSTSAVWQEIAEKLGADWTLAYRLSPQNWEEIVAGAFKKCGYEVVLTPRSGDYGRDVIATRSGVGCVKIIGSVKAYLPDTLVPYDHVRSLIGVMTGERDVSKGIVMTTSDFPPNIERDPFIAPLLPTR